MQWKLLFPQRVPRLWSSSMKDRFYQIFLALDMDEDKGRTQLLAPWGKVGKPMHATSRSLQSLVQLGPKNRRQMCFLLPRCPSCPERMCWHGQCPPLSWRTYSLLYFLSFFSFSVPSQIICYYLIAHQWEWHKMPFPVSSLVIKALFLQQKLLICSSLVLGGSRWGAAPFYYASMLLHSDSGSLATFTARSRQHSLLWKTSLHLHPSEEVTSPGCQRDRSFLVSLPRVGSSDISDSLDSSLFLCCTAQGVPQLQWKVSCQGSQPLHTPHTEARYQTLCLHPLSGDGCLKAGHSNY